MRDPIEDSTEPSRDRDPQVSDGAARQTFMVLARALGRQDARRNFATAMKGEAVAADPKLSDQPLKNQPRRRAAG